MTPKEKAEEIINKFLKLTSKHKGLETAGLGAITLAKQCALIAVDEIIAQIEPSVSMDVISARITYWQRVKQEIENIKGGEQ